MSVCVLSTFDPSYAEEVSGWARDGAEVLAWCSRSQAPVPPQVIAGWSDQPDVNAYAMLADGALVAYGELWVDHDEHEVELARLIVDPARRGEGVGRELVSQLVRAARLSYPSVVLRVLPTNAPALRCYAAAGFTRASPADEDEWNKGQPARYAWMTHGSPRP